MRDLASAQLKVADWLGKWSADDKCQAQYLTGSYIQSLYDVNASRLTALSGTDPDVKALKDETNEQQQSKIYDYLKARRDHRDPGVYGDESQWRKAALTNPYAKAFVDMTDAMGSRVRKHQANQYAKPATWEATGRILAARYRESVNGRMETFVTRPQISSHIGTSYYENARDRLPMFTTPLHRLRVVDDLSPSASLKTSSSAWQNGPDEKALKARTY